MMHGKKNIKVHGLSWFNTYIGGVVLVDNTFWLFNTSLEMFAVQFSTFISIPLLPSHISCLCPTEYLLE
jgi:hypothetical protein